MTLPISAPVVLTGASSGIGAAIARALSASGRTVIGLGRSPESLRKVAELAGERFSFCVLDLMDSAQLQRFSEEHLKDTPALSGLIHSAGVLIRRELADISMSELDHVMAVNFRAPFMLTKLLAGRLAAARGHLVFINSSAGLEASKGGAVYCASKFALRALADSARLELNDRGIRVASIYPGRTATPTMERLCVLEQREYTPELLLQPEDVARAVLNVLEAPPNAEVTDIRLRPGSKSY